MLFASSHQLFFSRILQFCQQASSFLQSSSNPEHHSPSMLTRCATRRQWHPSTRPANWCSFLRRLQRKHADIPQILRQRLCPRRACVSKINIDIWSRASSASGGGAQAREASPMRLPRRKLLHLAAGAAALPAVSRVACAQSYPARPVRIIVGFAPSGATDIMARLIGQWLSDRLSQQSVSSRHADDGLLDRHAPSRDMPAEGGGYR